MNELLQQFLIESRELVEQAMSDLMVLERTPEDRARIDSVFRAFHTLKGAAGIVEFEAMGRVVHAGEHVLASMRSGDLQVGSAQVTQGLSCLDQISAWLDAMEENGEPPADADAAATALLGLLVGTDESTPSELPPDTPPAWLAPLLARTPQPQSATLAICYTPAANCFFDGEDPLELLSRLPGLLKLDVVPRQPWPPPEKFDPFVCNLVIHALASATPRQAEEHLRSVLDQVWMLPVPRTDPGELPDCASTVEVLQDLPDRAIGILRAQVDLIGVSGETNFIGRIASAGRVASNVLRHLGRTVQATEVEAAAEASLEAGTPGPLTTCLVALIGRHAPVADLLPDAGETATPNRPPTMARALRVDTARIDMLVKLTGELTVVKNALGHTARLAGSGGETGMLADLLKAQHAQLEQLTVALQQSVLAVRVLPLRHVFQNFARQVRELAASMGKSVRLVTEGESTQADKSVVEALFEPLLHALRNAVDHGVEAPAQRVAGGKSETATIVLRGRRQGEHVIVEVVDDGRGVDVAAVRAIAADRRLLPADRLATLSDEEVVDLIFAPGFSTAGAVTAISGRGIGMDAVRSAIEGLGGRVSVHSRPGLGTTVRFAVPFTMMMTRVMTVEAAGQVFGVPFDAITETLQVPRERIVPIGSSSAIVHRGRTVPLVNLAATLGLGELVATTTTINTIVAEIGGQWTALAVERLGERLDIMLMPMDGVLSDSVGIAGTALMGDGRVLIVLDLQELLQ